MAMNLDYRAGIFAAVLLAATYALGRVRLWLERRETAKQRERAQRAELERDNAEGRAASEASARRQRETFATTATEVDYAARTAAAANPDDPDAAGLAADEYARRRWERLHADGDTRRGGTSDPVPRDPAPGAPTRGR